MPSGTGASAGRATPPEVPKAGPDADQAIQPLDEAATANAASVWAGCWPGRRDAKLASVPATPHPADLDMMERILTNRRPPLLSLPTWPAWAYRHGPSGPNPGEGRDRGGADSRCRSAPGPCPRKQQRIAPAMKRRRARPGDAPPDLLRRTGEDLQHEPEAQHEHRRQRHDDEEGEREDTGLGTAPGRRPHSGNAPLAPTVGNTDEALSASECTRPQSRRTAGRR